MITGASFTLSVAKLPFRVLSLILELSSFPDTLVFVRTSVSITLSDLKFPSTDLSVRDVVSKALP